MKRLITPSLLGAFVLGVLPVSSVFAAPQASSGKQDSFLLKVVGDDGLQTQAQQDESQIAPPGTEDLNWLQDQAARHYTIQLSSTRAPVDLDDPALISVREKSLRQVHAVNRTPPHHLLLLGSFSSFKAAKAYRDNLDLPDKHAWIRSFSEIQAVTAN